MEREKILNGLRCHAGCERGFDCGDCAYIGNGDCLDLLAMDAYALLKEQPKIVRCKDCTHRDHCELADGFGKSAEWFCANGERRQQDDR